MITMRGGAGVTFYLHQLDQQVAQLERELEALVPPDRCPGLLATLHALEAAARSAADVQYVAQDSWRAEYLAREWQRIERLADQFPGFAPAIRAVARVLLDQDEPG